VYSCNIHFETYTFKVFSCLRNLYYLVPCKTFKRDPVYLLHAQLWTRSVVILMHGICFRFHPNLILGGTYSGQIVLWDNRVQKRTPIQRTPLSTAAHTVICSISFVCICI
jgi:hypothetical protein